MPERNATLRTIAEKAGVSVAAVSYVLNGKGRMSDAKRLEIQQLLREIGYRPKYKRLPVIYLMSRPALFRDMELYEPFVLKYDGMNEVFRAEEVALRVEMLRLDSQEHLQAELAGIMPLNPGAFVLDSTLESHLDAICKFLQQHKIPALQLGHTVRVSGTDAVVVDNFGGAYEATRHLIAQGHRKLATIRWNVANDPASNKKFAGFTCALAEAGIPLRPEYVVESPFTKADGRTPGRVAIQQLLALESPPTAVFVENTFISPSLIYPEDPTEQGLPEAIRKLDIVHFEAWHLNWMEQALAGKLNYPPRQVKLMRIDWEELGRVAARLLLGRMEGTRTGTATEVIGLAPQLYQVDGYSATPLSAGAHT